MHLVRKHGISQVGSYRRYELFSDHLEPFFPTSPYFGFGTRYTSKMGSIMRNGSHVVGAKSMMHIWTTTIDKTRLAESSLYKLNIDEEADDINLQWELDVVKVLSPPELPIPTAEPQSP